MALYRGCLDGCSLGCGSLLAVACWVHDFVMLPPLSASCACSLVCTSSRSLIPPFQPTPQPLPSCPQDLGARLLPPEDQPAHHHPTTACPPLPCFPQDLDAGRLPQWTNLPAPSVTHSPSHPLPFHPCLPSCPQDLDAGRLPQWTNLPAPEIGLSYWRLPAGSSMRDLLLAVRADEVGAAL